MQVAIGLLLLPVLAMVALTVFDLCFRSSFRRLAVRNILRRPGEAVLVVIGSLLGTAIITAAFIVGDTFDASIRDFGRTAMGPIDEEVRVEDLAQFEEVAAALEAAPIDGTDGTLRMVLSSAAIAAGDSAAEDRAAEPLIGVGEVDFEAARAFGGDAAITGMVDAGPTPGPGELVLNDFIARELEVEEGDRVELFAYGSSASYVVRTIVPRVGLAGYNDAYVAPGTIASMVAASTAVTAQPPVGEVLVSNRGGVYDGVRHTEAVVAELERRVTDADGVEVRPDKRDLLEDAKAQGDGIGQLFSSIGAFSVVVGILLLVNLFVMLAEERKNELGMLRAVGLKRNHLMRTFGLEGAMYSTVAAFAGGLAGIGVGWAIVAVTRSIISADDPDLHFVFSVEPSSMITGILIGLVISLVTVWATSFRIARLNVIRAIRDVPEPTSDRLSKAKLILSLGGVGLGLLATMSGIGSESAVPILAGPATALLSAIPVLGALIGRRASTVGLAGLSLAWSLAVFTVFPEAMSNADISVFVVEGIVSVASAVLIVSSFDRVWGRLANGRSLAARLALAYPLARKVRTGILLAMFSLVIFTMTFMAVFTAIFGEQAGSFAAQESAGFDLFMDSNGANPVTSEQLLAEEDVTEVAPLLRGFPKYATSWHPEPDWWSMSGFDERLLAHGAPELGSRMARFADDDAAFRAALADPSLAFVSDYFLQDSGGPPENRLRAGDTFTVIDPVSGDQRTLVAAGIIANDWTFNGVLVNRDLATAVLGPRGVEARHYVRVRDGADADAVAERLTADLLANGVDARTFLDEIRGELREQQGFFNLMQGYLALGLAIGVAGLGVVMVRAVRERRRQVGMLRAMGFPARTVRRAFLIEAAFIAFQGVLLGIGLGLLTAYQVLSKSSTFGDQALPFSVPWTGLAILLVLPLLAAMAATVGPAAQAAAIRPAAALRIAD